MARTAPKDIRHAPPGSRIPLTKHERAMLQVRQLRADVANLEARLNHLEQAMRNDILGLELDLDAVKYIQVAILGITTEQWDEARGNTIAVYERRIAAACIERGLRAWFAGSSQAGLDAMDRAMRHYFPERFAAPPVDGEADAIQPGAVAG